MGAVLIATNPLFAAVFAHYLIAGDRMTAMKALGLLVAMAGTALALLDDVDLAAPRPRRNRELDRAVERPAARVPASRSARGSCAASTRPRSRCGRWCSHCRCLGPARLLLEEIAWDRIGPGPIAGLLYQGVVIAGIGFTVSFHLMKRYTPSVMMSFNFVSPVAGVLFAAWLLGDRVGPLLLAGMALVAAGLYLVASKPRAAG